MTNKKIKNPPSKKTTSKCKLTTKSIGSWIGIIVGVLTILSLLANFIMDFRDSRETKENIIEVEKYTREEVIKAEKYVKEFISNQNVITNIISNSINLNTVNASEIKEIKEKNGKIIFDMDSCKISIHSVDALTKRPLTGVTIYINNERVGNTDNDGYLNINRIRPDNRTDRIEIRGEKNLFETKIIHRKNCNNINIELRNAIN